jgi:hypothetical protein
VCIYQAMLRVLSQADHQLAASYALCAELWMVAMREFVAPEFIPWSTRAK